jgi:hypothetical protein
MCVNHRRADIPVPQQFLDSPNIVTIFEQVSRKSMAKGMTTGGLENFGFDACFLKHFLQHRLMQVVLPLFVMDSVDLVTGSGNTH